MQLFIVILYDITVNVLARVVISIVLPLDGYVMRA